MIYGNIGENIMKMTELKQFPEGLNLSFYLLLPLIFDKYKDWWSLLRKDCQSVYNGFIYDENTPNTENSFKIAINTEMSNRDSIVEFTENSNFINKYSARISDKENDPIFLDVYSFSINEKYLDSYEKIKINKYFEIDIEFKKRILSFWNATFNSNLYNGLMVSAIEPIKTSEDVLKKKDDEFNLATEFIPKTEEELVESIKGIKLA